METSKKNSKFKWIAILLAVLLIALTFYTYNLYKDSKALTSTLEIQKSDIEKELEDLLINYDNAIEENRLMDNDLIAARERIEILLDSVKDAKANIGLIKRYRIEIGQLKNERDALFKKADSLQQLSETLRFERDSTSIALNESIQTVETITLQNEALTKVVAKGAALKVSNLNGEGIKIRNNGKIVETNRSKRADKIRTCFTLNANEIAEKGDKILFIQVINPKNNVLGEKSVVNFEGKILTYSTTSNVFYENEALDVCVLVNANEADLIEGTYAINVFDGPKLVANSTIELK